ncbi:MAG: hypothetical protein PVI75_04410 [Gammaproteobacteria bacterium]|jgi:hypothetical protein
MSKHRKLNKPITIVLTGMMVATLAMSAYAQDQSGPAPVTDKQTHSLLGTLTSTIADKLEKLVKINSQIGSNMNEIYSLLVKPTSTKGVPDAAKYYLQSQGLNNNQQLTNNVQNTTKSLVNLTRYGDFSPSVDPKTLKTSPTVRTNLTASYNAADKFGNYSTTSVDSLLSANQYNINPNAVQLLLSGNTKEANKIASDQAKAALGFVQNAALANQPIPILSDADKSEAGMQYTAYRRTVMAIQSIANNTLANELVSRLPYAYDTSDTASKQNLLNQMNTADPGNSAYWDPDKDGIGSQGLLPRALDFMTRFFSINYNLNNITKQLNRMNLQLAMLISQNTLLIQNNIGKPLYEKAQQEKPKLKFKE